MFADLDVEMPALTMAVMNTSEWTASHWYVILIVIVAVVAAYHAFYRTDDGRRIIDEIKMHMPLFGKLTVKSACAEFARTMSTLLAAGLSTVSCLDIVSGIIKNILCQRAAEGKGRDHEGYPRSPNHCKAPASFRPWFIT